MQPFWTLSLCMLCMAALIVLYSNVRCRFPGFKDPIGKYPFGGRDGKLSSIADGWSISHLTFFTVLGYYFPDNMYAAMTYGLLWEFLEYLTEHTDSSLVNMIRGVSTCRNNHTNDGEHYFYSKSTDIMLNLCGFLIGSGAAFLQRGSKRTQMYSLW